MKLSARFLFAWVAVVLFSHGASHAQVLVQNAGFEEPVLADGVFTTEDGPHWKLGFYDVFVDPALWILGDDDGGVWNPDAADGFSDGAAFAGQNAGWAISHTGFDAGLSQILDATLEPDTEYVLSVQAGNPFYNESDETAQYRIELLAGGVLLASDSGDSPVADTWELHSLTYNSADNPEEVGEELEIRLIAVDYTDGGGVDGYEVDFDEVMLILSESEVRFVRGDADSDGTINLTDGIVILNFLFLGAEAPACMDAADVDDDGGQRPQITDAIVLFTWLFLGGPAPSPPTPSAAGYGAGDCGVDPTADDPVGCLMPGALCQ